MFPVGSALPAHRVCQFLCQRCQSLRGKEGGLVKAMNQSRRRFGVGLAIAVVALAGACGGRAKSGGGTASGGTNAGGSGGTSSDGAVGGTNSGGGGAGGASVGTAGTSGASGAGGGGEFACTGTICYGSGGAGGSGCHDHTVLCDSATQWCSKAWAGVGGGESAGCVPFMPPCTKDHSCACLASSPDCTCSKSGGAITVECNYP